MSFENQTVLPSFASTTLVFQVSPELGLDFFCVSSMTGNCWLELVSQSLHENFPPTGLSLGFGVSGFQQNGIPIRAYCLGEGFALRHVVSSYIEMGSLVVALYNIPVYPLWT